jgi:steroid 5-alpha reductase family enzyme
LYGGLTLGQAWSILSYEEKLLLGGVTAWGTRLFYLVASKSIARGHDDARYVEAKKDPGFWNKAAYQTFLPEAIMQTIITLPFTLPFRSGVESMSLSPAATFPSIAYHLAIFLFGAGFALDTLADTQLAAHKEKSKALNQDGVWSIVRHPNYLGDTLVHSAFPFLLYSTGLLHPIAVLGPIANYVFLRYVGGDAENEASQEERYAKNDPTKLRQLQQYRATKNSFWPRLQEFTNPWFLTIVGAGVGTVLVERGIRALVA